jgi:ribosome biogenesis GTPase / thiamine phosphate phosphatase
MNNIIININKDKYTVLNNEGVLVCKVRGSLRNKKIFLTVGDNVILDNDNMICDILPRKNSFIRPLISNINKLFIVISSKEPDFSTFLLDKFLLIALTNNVEPIIILTKYDLLTLKEKNNIKKILKYYKKLGYKTYINKEINKIKKEFKNNIVALTGQTGVGKSTLLNKIDKSLNLKTNSISKSLGRGKHTTREVTLYKMLGGLVADTPGFSSLEVNINKYELKNYFIEFNKYECKYKSCNHIKEDGCKIINNNKILKSRYNNYLKLYKEVSNEN